MRIDGTGNGNKIILPNTRRYLLSKVSIILHYDYVTNVPKSKAKNDTFSQISLK